jgi:peptide/nickel transport system permease protein
MRQYVIRRLLLFFPTLILVSLIIFGLIRVVPGDAALAMLGESDFSDEDLQLAREYLGLDSPLHLQYINWIKGIVTADLGLSFQDQTPIGPEIVRRIPLTLELAVLTMFFSLVLAVPIGVISALKQDSWVDYAIRSFSVLGLTMPTFWVGTIVIMILSIFFDWIPALIFRNFWEDPRVNFTQLIFPALVLGFFANAVTARMTRAQMLEIMRFDYIRTARAKGLHEQRVIIGHALRNALLPVTTIAGLQFGALLSGTVITETIFGLPGLGRLFVSSVFERDYPVLQTITLLFAGLFLALNLLIDLLYGWLDPRIRYQ